MSDCGIASSGKSPYAASQTEVHTGSLAEQGLKVEQVGEAHKKNMKKLNPIIFLFSFLLLSWCGCRHSGARINLKAQKIIKLIQIFKKTFFLKKITVISSDFCLIFGDTAYICILRTLKIHIIKQTEKCS